MKSRLKYLAAGVGVAVIALLAGAGVTGASTSRAVGEKISPQVALDWNVIAVNTVRAAAPAKFQIEGNLYMSYVQAAVYDAVTTIKGRYVPYHVIGISAPGASPRAAVAAAAYTTLSYYFPAQAASLQSTYTDYLNITLQALPAAAKQAGVAVGAAAAADLIATRWGDGRDAPVGTPFGVAPQAPGTWVFAPLPSTAVGPDTVDRNDAPVHPRERVAVPGSRSTSPVEPRVCDGAERSEGARRSDEHGSHCRADRDRAVLERERDQPVQPGVP